MFGCSNDTGNQTGNSILIDSFMYHYSKLDSIINANPYDTSGVCNHSIQYMERVTNLKAHPDGNFFGWMPFTRQDLIAWKDWHDKNNP